MIYQKIRFFLGLSFCGLLASAPVASAAKDPALFGPKVTVDWPAFLGRHDLVWEQLPRQWNEGAFVGNGQVGLMVYATLKDNRVDFHVGRHDVTDHRMAPDRKTSRGVPGASVMYDFPRLDIGRMALRPAGKIKDGGMKLSLWDAELSGTIATDLGELQVRVLTLRDRMVSVIEVRSSEKTADGSPAEWKWEFLPGNPASPRAQVFPERPESKSYETNPRPELIQVDGVPVCVQALKAGGDYATAWLEQVSPGTTARASTLYISTANEVPAVGRSAGVAVADVRAAAKAGMAALEGPHRAWWHTYYPRSFLTIPDARQEAFYWIQLYKFATCSRPDGPAVDLFGPYFRVSQWPGLWWNLNVQLTYWPVYAGNRLDLGTNLIDELDRNFDGLLADATRKGVLGDFAWVLHNYWSQYRFAGDRPGLHAKWAPKAKAVVAAYRPLLKQNAEGRLELAPLGSPEYHGFKKFPNTNYNLALLRWLLNALLEDDGFAGGAPDPQAAEWRRILAELIPYPTDENGLRIASNQAVDESHRHYSHLMALFPLYQLDPTSPNDRDLVVKSVVHWHKIGGGKGLAGYSYTGGASLYASLGMGDEANEMLQTFLTGKIGISALNSNTFYVESGGRNPVIETPLSAASATMDLLLQSWGGKIRVFPAVPSAWSEAKYHQLRAIGGFLVSASREGGKTRWVALRSEAGEPCVLKVPDWSGPVDVIAARKPKVAERSPGEYSIDLQKGEQIVVRPAGGGALPVIAPLMIKPEEANLYGVKRGREIKGNQVWPERPITGP